jgi:hypothetical protein
MFPLGMFFMSKRLAASIEKKKKIKGHDGRVGVFGKLSFVVRSEF